MGSIRPPIHQTLSEAHSRRGVAWRPKYQRRFLRSRPHFSAFLNFNFYIFLSLRHSRFLWICQTSAPCLQKFTHFLLNFKRDTRFCRSLSNFHRISSEFFRNPNGKKPSEFHRISVILIGAMSKWWYFIEIWEKCRNYFWKLYITRPPSHPQTWSRYGKWLFWPNKIFQSLKMAQEGLQSPK